MKPILKLSILGVILIFFACASLTPPLAQRPKSEAVNIQAETSGFFGWLAKFTYQKVVEYPLLTEKQVNAALIEEFIKEGHATGHIANFEQEKWLRIFWVEYFSKGEKPVSPAEIENKLTVYAKDAPVPVKKVIRIDAVENASNDSDKGWMKGVEVKLPEGKWQIRPMGGGWSAWRADSLRTPDTKGAWTWNIYVKKPNSGSAPFGEVSQWWQYKTEVDAFNGVRNQKLPFSLSEPSSVYFWIYESGNTEDNRGYVELELTRIL
jgi:hypothetical protein